MSNVVETAMQQALVDLIAISLRGKQMHWNLQGPEFHDLHTFLDGVIDRARTNYDEVAERMVQIGTFADGRANTVAETSILAPMEPGVVTTTKCFQQLEEDLMAVSKKIQETLDAVDAEDKLSSDILIRVCQDLEKDAWMLRARCA